jgi:hypothetical protein
MNTFLVYFEHFLVFVLNDPRPDHPELNVEANVLLEYGELLNATLGPVPVGVCVGRHPDNPCHFRAFRSARWRAQAGFHQIVGMPVFVSCWSDFLLIAADCGELVGY